MSIWPGTGGGGPHPAQLVLVRHGETDWNRRHLWQGHTDVPLNDEGRRQAVAVGERMALHGFDSLVSSDLSRARDTALAIRDAAGVEPYLDARLREIALGEWEGSTGAEIRERYPEVVAALQRGEDPQRGGGESVAQLRARMVAAYHDLAEQHEDEVLVVVSHGGALRTLAAHLLGLGDDGLDRLTFRANTGVTIFEYRDGFPRLTLLNCTRHLPDGE